MRLGAGEMLVVLVVVLLVFGPNKLPQLGDALGKGIRNFKKASLTDEPTPAVQVEASPALPAAPGSVRRAPAAERSVAREVKDPE